VDVAAIRSQIPDGIRAQFGEPRGVEHLGGLSGAAVLRLNFGTCTAILKQGAPAVELHVYGRLGELFRAHHVHMPRLLASGDAGGSPWLLIEDVPEPLSPERWLADAQVVAMLRRLHHIELDPALIPPDRYRPRWDDDMTAAARSLFPGEDGVNLRAHLDRLRDRAQPLFEGKALLSGDPNPRNWAVRPNGDPVLFDWERLTLGSPALDLAITVPGFSSRADFERLALTYWGAAPATLLAARADDLVAAKAWSVVEFLSGLVSERSAIPDEMARLLVDFPDWVRGLTASMRE